MKKWENSFAASLMYQDLGDCSIGSLPLVTTLEDAKCDESKKGFGKKTLVTENTETLRKVSAFLFIFISMITKIV